MQDVRIKKSKYMVQFQLAENKLLFAWSLPHKAKLADANYDEKVTSVGPKIEEFYSG